MKRQSRVALALQCLLTVLLVLSVSSCNETARSTPSSPSFVERAIPTRPTPSGLTWQGSTTVQSLIGTTPPCVPTFWREGFVQPISVTFMDERGWGGKKLLFLSQPGSSEACRLEYIETGSEIEGKAYYSDPLADASDCHFLVTSLGCSGGVWLLDPRLRAVFTDPTRRHLIGTLEMPYDYFVGGSERWASVTVMKTFDVEGSAQ